MFNNLKRTIRNMNLDSASDEEKFQAVIDRVLETVRVIAYKATTSSKVTSLSPMEVVRKSVEVLEELENQGKLEEFLENEKNL